MKYFIDTEFLEGSVTPSFFLRSRLGKLVGAYNKPTIDLISIGIVAEDGREYYAISKDFNLKEAWNRWQPKKLSEAERQQMLSKARRKGFNYFHFQDNGGNYWLRDNVLYPIYLELADRELHEQGHYDKDDWTYKEFKRLINKYGKTNKQIAEEVKEFTSKHLLDSSLHDKQGKVIEQIEADATTKEFYGYYSDYDWVVFCWLFGRMNDLPKGFPMYCIDLKQEVDGYDIQNMKMEDVSGYPKQTNEHNALADARWTFELYKFLNVL